MKNIEDLLELGIKPLEEFDITPRVELINRASLMMSSNIKTLTSNVKEVFMRLYNLKVSYAEFDEAQNDVIYGIPETRKQKYKFNGVYYSKNNNILFLSKDYDLHNLDRTFFEQIFRFLQKDTIFTNNKKQIDDRADLLKVLSSYFAYLASGYRIRKVTDELSTISTLSDYIDKFSMGIATLIVSLCSEPQILEGVIAAPDNLKQYLEIEFRGSINTISKELSTLLDLEGKKYYDLKKIDSHYFLCQKLIYTSYFENKFELVRYSEQIDEQVTRLNEFSNVVGVQLSVDSNNSEFELFKKKLETKFFDKYVEVREYEDRQSLMVIKENPFKEFLRKIIMHITHRESQNENTSN